MKNKPIILKDLAIPKENADVVWSRVQPFVEKHYTAMKFNSLYLDVPTKPFGMKELLISVYTQGLLDGNQLTQQK